MRRAFRVFVKFILSIDKRCVSQDCKRRDATPIGLGQGRNARHIRCEPALHVVVGVRMHHCGCPYVGTGKHSS